MAIVVHPFSTRRAAVLLYTEGHTGKSVAERFKVSLDTVTRWTRDAGVKKGDTKEQVEAKLTAWAEQAHGVAEKRAALQDTPAKAKVNDRIARQRYGPAAKSKEEAKKQFSGLLDPEEYKEAITTHMNQVVETLERCTTPQDQVNAQVVGMGLAMLKGLIDNPLPITTINDLKVVVGLVRQGLGMDDKKAPDANRIDIEILNARVPKGRVGKVIDVTPDEEELDI